MNLSSCQFNSVSLTDLVMASASSATGKACKHCQEKDKSIKILENKIEVVQQSFRGVVAAIKKSQLELQNRDKLINELSKRSNCSDHEQQIRLIELENNVSEMSKTVGACEFQRLNDKQLIQSLTDELEEMTQRLITLQVDGDFRSKSVKLFRNREVQTESETGPCVQVDAETQTYCEGPDVPRSQSRKAELAVVIPTHRPSNIVLDPSFLEESPPFNISHFQQERRTSESTMSGLPLSAFVGEIERKEIELAESRLKSRELEVALREIEWKYKMERLRLEAKVSNLEKENQNLLKDKTFQPNLIYVRNVLIKFIKTQDKVQKKIMMNALLTALDVQDRI